MSEISKVIIPVAGLGTRFLPLSKVVPKEFWPLIDKPVIQHIIEEAKDSGVKEIVFVNSPGKRTISEYFENSLALEKMLKERKKDSILAEIKELEDLRKNFNFEFVFQKRALGDGHAILQAAKSIGNEPCGVLFADDIVTDCSVPCLMQLAKIFKTCKKPVIALYRLPKEKLPAYGIVAVEKIANRLYKINKFVEKPKAEEAPSDLAIVGKYILTPIVFDYLAKAKPSDKGEIILCEVFEEMLRNGEVIYGYEFEGKWLECGSKANWLKSQLYMSLKSQKYGEDLKKFLRETKI